MSLLFPSWPIDWPIESSFISLSQLPSISRLNIRNTRYDGETESIDHDDARRRRCVKEVDIRDTLLAWRIVLVLEAQLS